MERDVIRTYLHSVGREIRWGRARTYLLRELSDHIADQEGDFLDQGLSPEEAAARAVEEMGDPVAVGRELDRLHRPQTRWEIVLFLVGIVFVGLVLHGFTNSHFYNGPEQYLGISLGLLGMGAVWLCDYPRLLRKGRRWVPLCFLLLVLAFAAACLAAPLTRSALPGAPGRWLLYLFLFVPLLFAAWLSARPGRGLPSLLLCHPVMLLGALVPALFPALEVCVILYASMLLVLTAAVWQGFFSLKRRTGLLAIWVPPCLLAGAFCLRHAALFSQRFQTFLHPDRDGAGYLYATLRSLRDSLSLFQGTDTGYRVTALYHDISLMLANLASRMGSVVFWAALLCILLFFFLCARRILALQSASGRLLAWAALWPLFFQGILYWLGNLGCSPLSNALPLPFVSYAPAGQIPSFLLAGVLLSVFRMDTLAREGPFPTRLTPRSHAASIPLPGGRLHIEYRAN